MDRINRNILIQERRRRRNAIKRQKIFIRNIIIILFVVIICLVLIISCSSKAKNKKKNAVASNIYETTIVSQETTQKEKSKGKKLQYNIKAPRDYTRKEIKAFLKKYAKEDENINYIYENMDDYDFDLLDKVINNPEMAEFVKNYYDEIPKSDCTLTKKELKETFPLFNQWDERWGHISYGDSDIGLAGCGPTCLSMVIYSLTRNEKVTPDVAAKYSEDNGYYVDGVGTSWLLMTAFPFEYGVNVREISLSEDVMKNELNRGNMIICGVGPGDFTRNGHFVVVYGYDEEGFQINDPNCIARSKKKWSYERLSRQIKVIWSYSLAE